MSKLDEARALTEYYIQDAKELCVKVGFNHLSTADVDFALKWLVYFQGILYQENEEETKPQMTTLKPDEEETE